MGKVQEAVQKAKKAWEAAPLHVKAMAGAYVDPIIVAMMEIAAALPEGGSDGK